MGGHGVLLSVLLNPEKYKSASAFGPVCNISNALSLRKGLTTLLGEDIEKLQKWDPTFLVKNYNGPEVEILIYLVSVLMNCFENNNSKYLIYKMLLYYNMLS